MADTYHNILLHLVFSTKDRQPWITSDLQPRLYEYMGGIVRGEGGVVYEIGGMPDHVHLLVRWRADVPASTLLRVLKSKSSLWVHRTIPTKKKFAWQAGYGAFSVSQSQVKRVGKYIANQEHHHKTKSFQEEFIGFLKLNGIEYDPKYIWA